MAQRGGAVNLRAVKNLIDKLRGYGLDAAQVLDCVEGLASDAAAKTANAERQARYRDRQKQAESVTSNVTSNVTDDKKEIPPTPPKEKTTSLTNVREISSAREIDFERLRKAYPKRTGTDPREPARKAFLRLVQSGVDPELMIAGAAAFREFRRNDDPKFTKQLVTWLNQRGWEDDYSGPAPNARAGPGSVMARAAMGDFGDAGDGFGSRTAQGDGTGAGSGLDGFPRHVAPVSQPDRMARVGTLLDLRAERPDGC
jgi:hypothetical protein